MRHSRQRLRPLRRSCSHMSHKSSSFDNCTLKAHNSKLIAPSHMPTCAQRSAHLFLPLRLSSPHLAPSPCIFVPSPLMLRLRYHMRNNQLIPLAIHRDKRQIGRRNMAQPLFSHILHHHPNPNFHRGPECPIHASLQNQQLAHPHRRHKIQMIHRSRHCKRPRMP